MSIDLNPSADQRQILDAAQSLLDARFPVDRLRHAHPDSLAEIADFGALGLALPEAEGGSGFNLADEALLHVAFGRHLVSPSVLAGALATRVALALERRDLAQAIMAGQVKVSLALPTSEALHLLDAQEAALALLRDGPALTLLDLSGAALTPLASTDESLTLASAAPGTLATIGTSDSAPLFLVADLLLAANLLGIAEATRDMAVAYAGIRQQFGQPIGAFQAVKHHCANMAIAAEIAAAQLDMAALHVQENQPDAAFQVASARHLAHSAALGNARLNIQIHGGIGFSAECDAHLFLKRAHALAHVGAPPDLLAHKAPLTPFERS